jgi:hypothetical protein
LQNRQADAAPLDMDCLLQSSKSLSDGSAEPLKRRNGWTRLKALGIADEYIRRNFYIIINLNREAGRQVNKACHVGDAPYRSVAFLGSFEGTEIFPFGVDYREAGIPCDSDDWRNDDVLVRIVEHVELVEVITSTFEEGFRGLDGVFHPLTGCFYSLARGFAANPVTTCGELEVAILCASVQSDKFPDCMVKGRPQIVDSIAYYKGELGRNLFQKIDSKHRFPAIKVSLDSESVKFFPAENAELPFKVEDVMVGPLKL